MEEQNILNGGIEQIDMIREHLEQRDSIKEEIENLIIRSGKLEDDVDAAKKETQETIDSTLKKRIADISGSFDKEINIEKGKLRSVRNKRDKAKNKGMRQRMDEETEDLRKAVRDLKSEIRTVFQSKGVPSICNTAYYYALYCPASVKDWLVLICTVLITLVALPVLSYVLLDWFWVWKMLAGIGIAVIFLMVYITVWLSTKDRFRATIVEMRGKRDAIAVNKKEIRKIKKEIRRDKDESSYNLEKYDEEIADIEERIAATAEKKGKALEEFERNTKQAIMDEIVSRNKEQIEVMQKELDELAVRKKELEASQKDLLYKITSSYEAFLGTEYMTPNKMEELKSVIQSGNASTIIEAVNYIKEHQSF